MSALARPHGVAGWLLTALAVIIALLILVSLGSWAWLQLNPAIIVEPPPGPLALLTQPIPDGPNAALLRQGRYFAIEGDCVSCHTRAGGAPFAGGLGLRTPFGVIYSANLTSDRATGIGAWTPDQFYHALHDGVSPGGHLYPAFPYPHFTMFGRPESDAMLAYLKTVPAVSYRPPANRLPFPLDIRLAMIGWNAINFTPHAFAPDPGRSADWNRGAYLVRGPGHCGACHTPKTFLGAEQGGQALQGATLDNWMAPNLNGNRRTGLGGWSQDDVVQYLRTGRNAHTNATGQMAEVVTYSTSLLSDDDLRSIATYLKSLPASGEQAPRAPDAGSMQDGAAVFQDYCTACHLERARGQPGMFPPLGGSALAQQRDPTTVMRLILAGGRTAPTLSRPSFQSMPSFAWKLDDHQIADVATYVRNSWGNRAEPVDPSAVSKLRAKLRLRQPLTLAQGHQDRR